MGPLPVMISSHADVKLLKLVISFFRLRVNEKRKMKKAKMNLVEKWKQSSKMYLWVEDWASGCMR